MQQNYLRMWSNAAQLILLVHPFATSERVFSLLNFKDQKDCSLQNYVCGNFYHVTIQQTLNEH